MKKVIWYETGEQRRGRLAREKKRKEARLAKLTPEEIERRKEAARIRKEEKKARLELEKEVKDLKIDQKSILTYKNRLRYNCETPAQYRERIKRSKNRLKQPLKSSGVKKSKKKQPKIKTEPGLVEENDDEETSEEENDPEETPEELIERKKYNFMCMELDLQIRKAENDLRLERSKSESLALELDLLFSRAKELKEFYGIPIVSNKMNKYHLTSLYTE